MGLGAQRNRRGANGANNTPPPQLAEVKQVAEQEHVEETVSASTPPTTRQSSTPAVATSPGGNAMATLNDGVLDNIDDMNIGGNYVTMDGSEFLFKATNETAKEIDIVVSYGKRFYQWFDEDNNQYYNSDTKLDDRYKMKFEIRWFEEQEEEQVEYIMTLPTASAMNFVNYVKNLANQGLRINQVITRLSISRQVAKSDNKIRYSRTEFKMVEVLN